MKTLIYILAFLVSATSIIAQPYGNEWIDYSQKYLKFQVVTDGVYKITYNDLSNITSIDIDTIDPTTIQIWGRGQQQYLYIEGESDNSFDLDDYIEFYARANDGWLDSLLYDSPESQVNPYYSLYNDTATYFITFNSSGSSLRYNNVTAGSIATPDDYFLETVVAYSPQQHWQGRYDSQSGKHDVEYTKGEGWFYSSYSATGSQTIAIGTPNAFTGPSAPDTIVEAQYAGVNNPGGTISHHVEVFYNGQTTPVISNTFSSFNMFKPVFSIPAGQISNSTTILFANGSSVHASAKSAVAYVKLTYPRAYSSLVDSMHMMRIPASGTTHQIELSSFISPFNQTFVYDFENNTRAVISNSTVAFTLPAGNERDVYVFSSNYDNFNSPIRLQTINNGGYFSDY
ncbi:MAG: hypothetical protein JKY42_05920 [Flavobacteriales bacterium]|nr:hypothetical protein [Flavobacteriales bacterium]